MLTTGITFRVQVNLVLGVDSATAIVLLHLMFGPAFVV